MEKELYRLATFYRWPDASDFSPLQLARNGFFFTGCGDEVECFICKVHLSHLRAKENLNERHKLCSPLCAFVCGNDSRNCPLKPPCLDQRSITTLETSDGDNLDEAHNTLAIENVCRLAIKRAISKNLFFTSASTITDRSDPAYDQLRDEQIRLSTFHDWPSGAQADPSDLAEEGFFYTGSADQVQCAFCRGLIRNWEPTDIPSVEHRRHYSDCPFVHGRDVGNVPLADQTHTVGSMKTGNNTYSHHEVEGSNSSTEVHQRVVRQLTIAAESDMPTDPPLFPEYSDIGKRIKSFVRGKISSGQTAKVLAEAGFFYVGPGDKVQCFHCAGNLAGWILEDDPWEQHKLWYGTCSYVRTHHPPTMQQIQEMPCHPGAATMQIMHHLEPREVKAHMDTANVWTLLNMGYSIDMIETALENHLSTAGEFPNDESLLEALFQLEETARDTQNNLQASKSNVSAAAAGSVGSAMPGEHVQSSTKSARKRKNRKKKSSAASNITSNEEEQRNILVNDDQNNPVSTKPEAKTAATTGDALQYAEQNRQLLEARMCKVCMDAQVDTVFLPCGHLVCCNNCSIRMHNCPICRKQIQGTVKTFLC